MLERGTEIRSILESAGVGVNHWDRRAGSSAREVSAWPPGGSFDWIGLRLPKGTDELRMLARVAAARLAPRGTLWIYGASDEGIRSVKKRLASDFGSIEDWAVGGRCRVIQARDPTPVLAPNISDWIDPILDPRLGDKPWVSFPGCFSHGRVDQGTALLLEHLPDVDPGGRVLDFACGTGILAGAIRSRTPAVELVLLDNDALSLEAARRNLPGTTTVLSPGFTALDEGQFDWIVSNPPYHRGKAGTMHVLEDLCRRAPEYLVPGGALRMVVQLTHAIEPLLKENFHTASVVAESPGFRVWESLTTS
jgi:16S rRNA (guanine1207-N2)-methyltransferase